MTKKRKLELSPRLQLLADWVPLGSRIVDVGTDHAFLPVWLMLNGKIYAHAILCMSEALYPIFLLTMRVY